MADVPVISQASPFSRTAVFPKGQVTIRDIAGLYIYENTLRGVEMTGAEVRDYLEYSARYFNQVAPGRSVRPGHRHERDHRGPPHGHPGLQLRRALRARLRHRHLAAGRLADPRPDAARRHPRRRRRPLRDGRQQLPAERWRGLPGRRRGSPRLRRAARDPAAADRLGERARRDRPGRLLRRELVADVGRGRGPGRARSTDPAGPTPARPLRPPARTTKQVRAPAPAPAPARRAPARTRARSRTRVPRTARSPWVRPLCS